MVTPNVNVPSTTPSGPRIAQPHRSAERSFPGVSWSRLPVPPVSVGLGAVTGTDGCPVSHWATPRPGRLSTERLCTAAAGAATEPAHSLSLTRAREMRGVSLGTPLLPSVCCPLPAAASESEPVPQHTEDSGGVPTLTPLSASDRHGALSSAHIHRLRE